MAGAEWPAEDVGQPPPGLRGSPWTRSSVATGRRGRRPRTRGSAPLRQHMRVAIEAASLGLSSGGLARYTAELSLALARCFPDDQFFLLSDQPFRMPPGSPSNLQRGGGPRNSMERRWWLWGMAREMGRLGVDLVHGPDFAVPYIPRRPSVLSLGCGGFRD